MLCFTDKFNILKQGEKKIVNNNYLCTGHLGLDLGQHPAIDALAVESH